MSHSFFFSLNITKQVALGGGGRRATATQEDTGVRGVTSREPGASALSTPAASVK